MQTANLYDYELYLFHQGTNCRAYQLLGGFFYGLERILRCAR